MANPARNYELDGQQMVRAMSNVGARAESSTRAISKGGPLGIHQRRALALVGECHELGCPPPVELVHLLSLAFRDPKDRRDGLLIAGNDAGNLQGQFQNQVISSMLGVRPGSTAAFHKAAEAEVRLARAGAGELLSAPILGVATAANVDRKSIREWREKLAYRELVAEYLVWTEKSRD